MPLGESGFPRTWDKDFSLVTEIKTPLRHSSKAPKTKHKLPKKHYDALKIHSRILNCVYFKWMANHTSKSKMNFHMITFNVCMHVKSLQSCPTLCNPMDHSAPLSMGFSRQESWSWLTFPSPGDLPNQGIQPTSLMSPALAGGFFTTSTNWEA